MSGADASTGPQRARSVPWSESPRASVRDTLIVLAVFLAARGVSALFLASAARRQPDLSDNPGWHVEGTRPADPGYWGVLSNWDGQWFETIALHGYPAGPPQASVQTPWAFPPGYPLVVRTLMGLTGGTFEVVGSLVSLSLGALAMVLLFRWVASTRGRPDAFLTVVGLSTFLSAPILNATYSEGMALFLLVLALRAALESRWLLLGVSATALTFTRPVVLPIAALLVLLELSGLRATDPAIRRRRIAAAFVLVILSFAWPASVAVSTGEPGGYATALSGWARDGATAESWFVSLWGSGQHIVAVLLVLLLVGSLYTLWPRKGDGRPPDRLALWSVVYLGFMLLATPVGAGILRHLLLTLAPVLPTVAHRLRGHRVRGPVVVALVLVQLWLQWLWVQHVFVVAPDHVPGVFP